MHERKHGKYIYLIYSMGKVGSSTVKELVEQQFPFLPCFQPHFLSDHWLKEIIPAMPEHYHVNLKPAQEFNEFRKLHPEYKVKIITLVREPVIRDISDVFENWRDFFKTNDMKSLTSNQILERLHTHNFEYTLNWFDTEFKAWTGVNVYEQDFDKGKGYSIWQSNGHDILCIQLEQLNEVLCKAMSEFAGLKLQPGKSANTSEQKGMKELYRTVASTFSLSNEQQAIVYQSKYVNHFYSANDINRQKQRWVKSN